MSPEVAAFDIADGWPELGCSSSRSEAICGVLTGMAHTRSRASFQKATIEQVAAFWDRRPCNIRHSLKDVGTREYFDEVEARKYFVEPHIPAFTEFPRWRGKKVLEIGCGIGTDTISFARQGAWVSVAVEALAAAELVFFSTYVWNVRISLEVARRRAEVYGLQEHIRFYQGNAEELSAFVPREPYDLVYSFGVIHHSPRPGRIVEQMRAYVRPGSTLKVMVYHRYSWKALWILLSYGQGQFWQFAEVVAKHSEAQTGCPTTYTFSRRECRELLERRSFRVTEIRVEHIFPYRIPEYIQHKYVKVWCFRWMPLPLFHWLERRLGWHLCMTAEAS